MLDDIGMTQAELARRTGRPLKTINEIVQGKTAIIPDTALQLERVLRVPASEWIALDAAYREYQARLEEKARLSSQTEWLHGFPWKDLVKLGLVKRGRDSAETLDEVLRFLGVASPAAWEDYWTGLGTAFRKSPRLSEKQGAIAAWLRIGELAAREVVCASFDMSSFRRSLPSIRALTRQAPEQFQPALVETCAGAGVAVVFVPELTGTHVFGATRWVTPDKAVIQLSLRYKTDDQFWFTFFHDAGHIILHGKRGVFVDVPDAPQSEGNSEAEADSFAGDLLIPPADFQRLVEHGAPTTLEIVDAAERLGIGPGVIVGRLQHDRILPSSRGNELKRRFELKEAQTKKCD